MSGSWMSHKAGCPKSWMSLRAGCPVAGCPIKLDVRKAGCPVAECPKAECPKAECLSVHICLVSGYKMRRRSMQLFSDFPMKLIGLNSCRLVFLKDTDIFSEKFVDNNSPFHISFLKK